MAPSKNPQEFDLIVIGSGPAGQRAAVQAAKLGKKALLIERGELGGSCLYTGTIPSKTLREAALQSTELNPKDLFDEVMAGLSKVISSENAVIENQLKRNNVTCINGTASFIDPWEIQVKNTKGTSKYRGTNIIIATGTRPARPDGLVFDDQTIFDSDTILKTKALPHTLAILGAGVIGSEYASIFANLGVKVTLIDRRTQLLRGVDEDVIRILTERLRKQEVELVLGADLDKVRSAGQATGVPGAEITFKQTVPRFFDALLYCMGRVGNVEELALKNAKVTVGDRGIIATNAQYQTNVPHIYAVGDIIGHPALAASSAEQGRIAANFIFTQEKLEFPRTFPYGIYTIPEISNVGKQEAELVKEKVPYVIGKAFYKELARGKILGDDHGFLKILVHQDTRKILGVHIIGSHATELIHIGQVAMAFDGTIDFLVENVFNYPTLAEAYKVAAYNAYNQLR